MTTRGRMSEIHFLRRAPSWYFLEAVEKAFQCSSIGCNTAAIFDISLNILYLGTWHLLEAVEERHFNIAPDQNGVKIFKNKWTDGTARIANNIKIVRRPSNDCCSKRGRLLLLLTASEYNCSFCTSGGKLYNNTFSTSKTAANFKFIYVWTGASRSLHCS